MQTISAPGTQGWGFEVRYDLCGRDTCTLGLRVAGEPQSESAAEEYPRFTYKPATDPREE